MPERGTLLCLLCVASALVAVGTGIAALEQQAYGWLFVSVLTAITSFFFRAAFRKKLFGTVNGFLLTETEKNVAHSRLPDALQWGGFVTAMLAFRVSVSAALLMPAVCCLRIGAKYYALSGEEETFLLAVKAALCLTISGILFTVLLLSRFGYAEYLYLSGRCCQFSDALEASWQLTRESGGEWLTASVLALPLGLSVGSMTRMNAAAAVCRLKEAREGM